MSRLLFIISLFISGAVSSHAQLPEHIKKDYELVWQDEFDGNVVDTSKWEFRYTGSRRGYGIVKAENCYLDNAGHLIIEAKKADTVYHIGQVGTQKTFLVQYGYFECSVQLITQVGSSCSFWLQSPSFGKIIDDPAKSGTEIDIFEYRKKVRNDEVHHTIHWNGYGEFHEQHGKSPIHKGIDTGFHTFGLEWTADKYVFYVDGKKSWSTKKSVSQIKQYIILSLEMNNWSGDPSNSTYPDKAVYDYVRVYQKKK